MEIIRRASFKATPWKNGGGVTHEAARSPAAGDPFRWRLSVAEIESSGPFSDFAGYYRTLILLRGDGVRLRVGARQVYLREPGDLVEFDGAARTDCLLLGGPCVDLNLMVSTSLRSVDTAVLRPQEPFCPAASASLTRLVFVIRGQLSICDQTAPPVCLDAWDLAVLSPGAAVTVTPVPSDATPASLVFCAALDDNPVYSS